MMEHLLQIFQDTFGFIIALSVLIVVHEWGHFITAKKLGIKVERFSLGFGPKLWGKVHDGTEFLLCLIPLGGYVKMAGDERHNSTGAPEEFFSKSPGHRSLVVLNGPVVNFVLAYACFVFAFIVGYPDLSTRVADVIKDYPAHMQGLQVGDEVIEINGKKIYGWSELQAAIASSKTETINLTVMRATEPLTLNIAPKIDRRKNIFGVETEIRTLGIGPYSSTIDKPQKKSPALAAGFRQGDKIIAINGQSVGGWSSIEDAIQQSKAEFVAVRFLRDSEVMEISVKPEIVEVEGEKEGMKVLGIRPLHEFSYYKFGVLESFTRGYGKLWEITAMTYRALFSMLTGTMSAKENVGGPVLIFSVFKAAAEEGFVHWVLILGIVSASLAIFNLLPVIPLDGGHLFLLGIEKVRGKALPPKVDDWISRVGFSLIILLAVFVFYSDFDRIGLFDKIKSVFPK